MKHLCLIAIGAFPLLAQAGQWKVAQTRGNVFYWDGRRALRPARGEALPVGSLARVGANGGLRLESDDGSFLSVLGPAQLGLDSDAHKIKLDYGDYRALISEDTDLTLAWGQDGHAEAGAEFYAELGLSGLVRLHAVSGRGVSTSKGRLAAGNSEFQVGERLQRSTNESDEIERLRQRHESFRLALNESEAVPVATPWTFGSAIELQTLVGFSRLEPRHASTFQQETITSGLSARYVKNFFISLPKRPQRPHGLKAPRFRLGLELASLGASLRPKSGYETAPLRLLVNGVFGYGGYGLFGNLLLGSGYSKILDYKMSPLFLALEGGYRWDIKDLVATETETGLLLSFLWSPTPVQVSGTATAGVSPANFTWHVIALRLGLSFLL